MLQDVVLGRSSQDLKDLISGYNNKQPSKTICADIREKIREKSANRRSHPLSFYKL